MDYSKTAKQYCLDIVSGKIKACWLVIAACQRHLDDLEKQNDPDFPYRFDEKKANKRCKFSEKFKHVKGKWTGQRLKLEPHQVFIQCAIWGWVHKETGLRRFRIAYIEKPRKNGKSTDMATAGLFGVAADGEPGAEIYSGATSEKQAQEVFRPAWQMAHDSEDFRNYFGISLSGTKKNPTSIYRLEDMSRFELLIGNPGDGSSPHYAIVDEYHEHRTSDQFDTMETGMGAREQPLMLVITTAGDNVSGPCYDMHLKAIKILEKTMEDDAFFAIIFTIDQEDSYEDFENWKKANPNYGVSIMEDYLKRKYKETMTDASKQNVNLRKHLNVWTNAGVAWMNMVKWAACRDTSLKLDNFKGQACFAGLDLASKIDIAALVLLFEYLDGFCCFGKYYLPEETIGLAGNEHYEKWVKDGLITATLGAQTDFKYIEDDLKVINADFPIKQLAFDPRESGYLINNIMEWIEPDPQKPQVCIEITQGPALMSQPMKELEGLIYAKKMFHNDDPVLTWMIGNVVKKQGRGTGPVKYYYPTKEKDAYKIDGAVCLIMALGQAMRHQPVKSIYDDMTEDEIKERMGL